MITKVSSFFVISLLSFTNLFGQFSLYMENNIPVQAEKVGAIKISKDGRFLAFGDQKGSLTIWDLDAKRELHTIRIHKKQINSIIFDSSNQRLISCSDDKKIAILDLYSGQTEKIIDGFKSQVKCLDLSPGDKTLASGGKKNEIYLWEFPFGSLKGKLKAHKKDVLSLSFNVNGNQLFSVGRDRLMVVWDVGRQQLIRKTEIESKTIKNSGIDIHSAHFSSDKYFVGIGMQEHVLAKGGRGMKFKYNLAFYDWKTGSEIEILEGHRKDVDFFAISPDKNYVVTDNSTLRANQISFWNIQKGIVEQNYPVEGKITAIEMSENGEWLAVANTEDEKNLKSFVSVWKLSGIEGYKRFDTNPNIVSAQKSGFGSAMKLNTPEQPLIQFGERKKLAVMYFDNSGLSEDVAKTTSYLLEGKLGNSPFIELIERNQINSVISELKYQISGLTKSGAVDIGKHLNAKYILIGSINKLGNLLIITAKLVNVETAQIEGTREVQCNNATIENISDMVSLLAPTIAKF